jgi:hypothetical protein
MGLQINNKTSFIAAVPAVNTSGAYTTGQVVGGLLTFAQALQWAQTGVLMSLCLADKSNNKTALDIFFFKAKPAGAFADGVAFAPSAADLLLLSGFVSIVAGSWSGGSANAIATLNGIRQIVLNNSLNSQNAEPTNLNTNLNLYAVIVARSTPTYASATDLQLSLGIQQD